MKFFRKMYQKSGEQGGFTLVEMIVVLVIIAILAAITIPALLKYIDKARDKQVLIDTRSVCMATQSAMTEAYATDTLKNMKGNAISNYYVADKSGTDTQKRYYQEIVDLAGISSLENNKSAFGAFVDNEGILSLLIYQDGNKDGDGKVAFYFRETDEYKVYDKADFNSFTTYFGGMVGTQGGIKDRVFCIGDYKDPLTGEIHAYLNRTVIKDALGYDGEL